MEVDKESNDIERVTGFVAGSYECVYDAIHGTLYAGSTALYFVGTFFLFEKKVIIPWDRVRQVQKLDQGVAVIGKDEAIHSFTALHAPARAWVILVSLHNDALLDYPGGDKKKRRSQLMAPEVHHSVSRRVMKRRNSDPANRHAFVDQSEDEMKELNQCNGTEVFRQRTDEGEPRKVEKPDRPKRPVIDWFNNLAEPKIDWFNDLSEPKKADIEDKVGGLKIEGIRCVHGGYNGKLYAGNKGLFYYGKRMLWESEKVLIPFNSIRQFQIQDKEPACPQKRKSAKRVLKVTTKDEKEYDFQSIDSPDQVWASLITLRNETFTSHEENRSRSYSHSLRRMNSDPMMPSKVSFDESSEENIGADDLDQRSVTLSDTDDDIEEEWKAELARKKDYDNTVINGQTLPCTMDKFLELFVADGAPYSVAKFLESRGDSDLDVSKWKKSSQNKESRVIQYKHPVNAPLAPPLAGARKEQSYKRYGDYGLCLETKTIVDDVPMADCFYVADRVCVVPKATDAVTVTMEFDITFVKTTMFRSIIGNTTKSEFTDLFESLFRYYKDSLGEPLTTTRTTSVVEEQHPTPQPRQPSLTHSTYLVAVLFVLLIFQIYTLWEVRKMSAVLQELQGQCHITENGVFSL